MIGMQRIQWAVLCGATVAFIAAMFPAGAQALVALENDADAEYSPCIGHDFPDRVFFGDTHLHTGYSADAGLSCSWLPALHGKRSLASLN